MQKQFVLTEAMVESFYREGYFYAPGFISPETVERLNEEYAQFANAKGDGQWKSVGFKHFAEHAELYPVTAEFLTTPYVVKAFETILGGDVKLWLGMYAVVDPGGEGLKWHQDNMYTHILGHMLNGFIALDPISQENAGLWIAPRSHLLGRQANISIDANGHKQAADPENGIPCQPMAPGDMLVFHRETLHHSKMNHTDRPRRAYAFQVASATCRYAESGKLLDDRDLLSIT